MPCHVGNWTRFWWVPWVVLATGCSPAVPQPVELPSASASLVATQATPPPASRQSRSAALHTPPEQLADYSAERTKTVVDLQPFRQTSRLSRDGREIELVDLNPQVGIWYLLRLGRETYHLQTAGVHAELAADFPDGLVLTGPGGRTPCTLWPGEAATLEQARATGLPFAPLCDGHLLLRNPVQGHRTSREQVTDFLRDHVWQGEQITVFVRDTFFRDAWRASGELGAAAPPPPAAADAPPPLLLREGTGDHLLTAEHLGLPLEGAEPGRVAAGRWYHVQENPGVYLAALRPDLVAPEVVEELKGKVSPLDSVESASLVYLVAFDLSELELGFSVGADHPRVDWSEQVLPAVRDDALPGPDGIGSVEPLVRTGLLDPDDVSRVVATFTAGFKRRHGAFRYSELASRNHGSHYGFVENGVVLSKLQPGLSTAVVWDDGSAELKTWTAEDDAELGLVRHARQNGVPILELDPATGHGRPGARVRQWGEGNWSGSADRKLRTLRAGLCQQDVEGRRFITYGYFSSATPSAMATVFRAAGCSHAMLLDMNALEHTYLASYAVQGSQLSTRHLIDEMSVVDSTRAGVYLPRFISAPDSRDFFYVLRRNP
jgi:hypothetical protein